jgi:phosphopantetheinyl transferase
LSGLSKDEQLRVTAKRLVVDSKMALASILLQRHYIFEMTGLEGSAVNISRTEFGKPYFDHLHYNVSHHDGIVVLVGFSHPIGVDIVSRRGSEEDYDAAAELMLSDQETSDAKRGKTETGIETMKRINIAFKEAYMKFTGEPDWDQVKSIQFLDIALPYHRTSIPNAVGRIIVNGKTPRGYCEYHFVDSLIIAVYTSHRPEDISDFATITLEKKCLIH